ncbi:hypothetical protein CROQUDRAFT_94234 [Cronartium quercuum f. sp. fusiforme G11]|uniref:Uncharacterized protein n=1 Tax=Cronartium quercuum f. sp. fusiforme G11 TaxID=708437 RepID=A0A9P6TAE7_9BASI|nr:hypothetical protein CROQUDRAFT_94234 [Cronartium quercuum f. sp. fusiforme G11]
MKFGQNTPEPLGHMSSQERVRFQAIIKFSLDVDSKTGPCFLTDQNLNNRQPSHSPPDVDEQRVYRASPGNPFPSFQTDGPVKTLTIQPKPNPAQIVLGGALAIGSHMAQKEQRGFIKAAGASIAHQEDCKTPQTIVFATEYKFDKVRGYRPSSSRDYSSSLMILKIDFKYPSEAVIQSRQFLLNSCQGPALIPLVNGHSAIHYGKSLDLGLPVSLSEVSLLPLPLRLCFLSCEGKFSCKLEKCQSSVLVCERKRECGDLSLVFVTFVERLKWC